MNKAIKKPSPTKGKMIKYFKGKPTSKYLAELKKFEETQKARGFDKYKDMVI